MNKWLLYGLLILAGAALSTHIKALPVVGTVLSKVP